MKLFKNKVIKIPNNLTLIYCTIRNQITVIGPLKTKSIKIPFKIFFKSKKNIELYVTQIFFDNVSNNIVKKKLTYRNLFVANFNKILIEVRYTLYQKLNFVGVGYRSFIMNDSKDQVMLKLGYSHLIYFKLENIFCYCIKFNKLFLFGNSGIEIIKNVAGRIRKFRKPEPYKGKGILYFEEKVNLKIGKKI